MFKGIFDGKMHHVPLNTPVNRAYVEKRIPVVYMSKEDKNEQNKVN